MDPALGMIDLVRRRYDGGHLDGSGSWCERACEEKV